MIRRLRVWVFSAGTIATAITLWGQSGSRWGATEEYVVWGSLTRTAEDRERTRIPRLALRTLEGRDRRPIEVPQRVADEARADDVLRIRTRLIPILQGELLQYSLVRRGVEMAGWDEGEFFYGTALAIGSLAGGVAILGLFALLSAVFRWQAPSE